MPSRQPAERAVEVLMQQIFAANVSKGNADIIISECMWKHDALAGDCRNLPAFRGEAEAAESWTAPVRIQH